MHSTTTRGGRRRSRLAMTAALPATAALALLAAAAPPVRAQPLPPPPIPLPQPGTATAACAPPPAPGWSRFDDELRGPAEGTMAPAPPSFEIAVDPARPCTAYRSSGGQAVDRTVDAGRTWQPVLRDTATGGPLAAAFAASGLYVPSVNSVVVSERGNGDGVLASADRGHGWSLLDEGLNSAAIEDLAFAPGFIPGRAGTAYALAHTTVCAGSLLAPVAALPSPSTCAGSGAGAPSPLGLFVTTDGGESWAARALPALPALGTGSEATDCAVACGRRIQVAMAPRDPSHLWLLVNLADAPGDAAGAPRALLFSSGDAGQSFGTPVQLGEHVSQLLATSSSRQPLRLYLVEPAARKPVQYTDDGGTTMATLGLTGFDVDPPVLAADPADNDILLAAGVGSFVGPGGTATRLVVYRTSDAFESTRSIDEPAGMIRPSLRVHSPLQPDTASLRPAALVQADAAGVFYLTVAETCVTLRCDLTLPPAQGWTRQSLWRLASPDPRTALPAQLSTVQSTAVQQVACTTPPSVTQGSGDGSLAYDGRHLLYTVADDPGAGPLRAVIHEMDPLTCADAGQLLVDFDAADIDAVERATTCVLRSAGHLIGVDTMTYDPNRNLVWATLFDTNGDWNCGLYVFQISVLQPAAPPTAGLARARLALQTGCNTTLSYDYTDDTLWTCDGTYTQFSGNPTYERAGHIRAADGRRLPTCMTQAANHSSRSGGSGPFSWATWLVAPPRIYIWDESDDAFEVYDEATCVQTAVIVHPSVVEPGGEDEEMACDPLTRGPGSPLLAGGVGTNRGTTAAVTSPITLLWTRDAATITAYRLPAGLCPLPTTTLYSGAPRVAAGVAAPVCATTQQRYPGGALPVGLPVSFTYDGVTDTGVHLSGAIPAQVTTQAAAAPSCVSWQRPPPPGTYRMAATFGGNDRYLASAGAGTLRIDGQAPLAAVVPSRSPLSTGAAGALPPPPPVEVPVPAQAPQAESAVQAEAQLQTQAQSQSQSVAQVQPGVMLQPQRARQVAVQTARRSQAQPAAVLASRVRRSRAAPVGAVGGAMTMLLLSLLPQLRRVRPAWVRGASGERRCGRHR